MEKDFVKDLSKSIDRSIEAISNLTIALVNAVQSINWEKIQSLLTIKEVKINEKQKSNNSNKL